MINIRHRSSDRKNSVRLIGRMTDIRVHVSCLSFFGSNCLYLSLSLWHFFFILFQFRILSLFTKISLPHSVYIFFISSCLFISSVFFFIFYFYPIADVLRRLANIFMDTCRFISKFRFSALTKTSPHSILAISIDTLLCAGGKKKL